MFVSIVVGLGRKQKHALCPGDHYVRRVRQRNAMAEQCFTM
jgi:hypothetical protein